MKDYSSLLQPNRVEELYDQYFSAVEQRYSDPDYRLLAVAKAAAFAYETITHNLVKAEAMYKRVQRLTSMYIGEWTDANIEAWLSLVRLSRRQNKVRLSDIQLEKLWTGMLNASEISLAKGHTFQISELSFRELYEKLLKVYYTAEYLRSGPFSGARVSDSKITLLNTQYATVRARHYNGSITIGDRAFMLARSLERDGRAEDAIAQYERVLKLRMSTEDNTRLEPIGYADSASGTGPYVKFHSKLAALQNSKNQDNALKEAVITSARMTEVVLRLCKLYIAQGSQSSLLKGFELIQRERENLATDGPKFLELMKVLGIMAASLEKIESLQLEWVAELRESWEMFAKDSSASEICDTLELTLQSIYWKGVSGPGNLLACQDFWRSVVKKREYKSKSLESMEVRMVSACIKDKHSNNGDFRALRALWDTAREIRPQSKAFFSMTKSLGSHYASTNQMNEFTITCRGFDDALEGKWSSSELTTERTETLSGLYQQVGLEPEHQVDINKALRIIDRGFLANIVKAESI